MTTKILVIDDDLHFVQVLNRTLARHQYLTAFAHTGEEALNQAAAFQPDWITLDLRLEKESGLSLIEPLKERCKHARIVVLTGYASIPTAVEAIKLGADNYLHKPVTVTELIHAFDGPNSVLPSSTEAPLESEVMSMERLEWEHIQRILNEYQGNISATARALNMHRRTLQRKLQKHAPKI